MKTFIGAFLLGILSFYIYNDTIRIVEEYTKKDLSDYWIIFPTTPLSKILVKNCTKDTSKNGHGWVFVRREYWSCNKIEINISDFLFGEYEFKLDK